MAPLKRAHNAGEPRAGPANPGSSENEPRKRPRVSDVLAGSSDSDSEATDSSNPSDSDSGDDETELEPQEKRAACEENTPVDSGVIERVDCYNFMCHEHFSVELGPLINFIVGKNGSGKSAVLTAITLCLGGKASFTNRGQSLKSFIKEGKESATVVVRIKNQGDNAYLQNEYGPSIIVERHFSKSGATGFRLKSSTGRVVSTKKADLDAITDFYALQMDNPMNVLSQDMARQFMGSSTPEEKYKFFVKGVQLQQLDQDYALIAEYSDQTEEKLRLLDEDVQVLLEKREKAKARLALANRHESLTEKIKSLRAQVAWAQVEEQELVLASREQEIAEIERKIVQLETEVENSDGVFQGTDRAYEDAKRASETCRVDLEGRRETSRGVKAKCDEALKERLELKAQQVSITDHLKATTTQIANTQQKIEEENRRLANLDGGTNSRKFAELEQRKDALNLLQNRYKQHKRERGRLQEEIKKAETELGALNEPFSRKKEELDRAQNRLRDLTRDRGKQQTGFSDKMPLLLRAIQQETSFSQQPVGPLGSHMRLLKPQWSAVLESTFGGTLSSFVVSNKQDMNTLSKLMHKVHCPCQILIGNDTGHIDTSAHEPDPQFDTALRVLEIDHPLVRKQLVITHAVEQMLLIEDLAKATSVLFDGARPRNVKRCFCIDKIDKRRGIHLSFGRTGEPTQSPVQAYNGHPRMKTDVESQIRMQQEVVDNLSRDLEELVQKRRSAQQHLQKCKQSLMNHGEQERELQVESQKAEDVVQELREEIDLGSMNDGQLNALQSSLDEAAEEKRLNEESYKDAVNALDEAVQKLKVLKRELAGKDAAVKAAEAALRGLQEDENRLSVQRRKALGDKNIAIGRVEEAKKQKVEVERQRQEVSLRIEDFSEKASMVSPRVRINAGENMSRLEKKLAKFTQDRDRYRQELGATPEELQTAEREACQAYERSNRHVDEIRNIVQALKKTVANRRERWKKFRDLITARARLQFQYLLSERGFRGKLLTDHTNRLLDIQIQPDITKKGEGHKTESLSGGEKSFSQICLLLALWEAMGSPIRCLDEFDVFMDVVNRRLAIDLLMGGARRSVGRQFILITPGSRSDISFAPDVRVKELAEPERGQQTLPFSN